MSFCGLFRFAILVCVLSTFGCSKAYVPTRTDVTPEMRDAVNINTANADVLESLPGIGPKTAQAIIEHREMNGPFRRAEHLMLVDGISEKDLRKLRRLITVGPPG